jgi:hypothetical protein
VLCCRVSFSTGACGQLALSTSSLNNARVGDTFDAKYDCGASDDMEDIWMRPSDKKNHLLRKNAAEQKEKKTKPRASKETSSSASSSSSSSSSSAAANQQKKPPLFFILFPLLLLVASVILRYLAGKETQPKYR